MSAWMPTWEKQRIAETYYELTKGSKKTTATKVHSELVKRLKQEGKLDDFPISLRTVQSIVTELRRAKVPSDEDISWNIAMSKQFNLPPEETMLLFKISAMCLAMGQEFTVRKARWVCYLRHMKYFKDFESIGRMCDSIYHHACRYAQREQVCEELNIIPTDTYDLDLDVGMPVAELLILCETGLIDKNRFNWPKEDSGNSLGGPVWTVLSYLGFDNEFIINNFSSARHILEEHPSFKDDLIEDDERIFAYYMRYISKAPKWAELSKEERESIALKLRSAIVAHSKELGEKRFDWGAEIFRPLELFKNLGIKVDGNYVVREYAKTFLKQSDADVDKI